MHPRDKWAGFALAPSVARAHCVILLCGAIIVLSGCGPSTVSRDKPITLQAVPERGQPVGVVPMDTDATRPLTADELARQHQLETELAAERPTHRLKFRDGHVLDGWVISESPTTIRFRDGFGYSGYVVESYRWGDVVAVDALPATSFEVTARDVRFSSEFPRFHFVKSPPYTIVTDESYGEVQKALGVLTDLREQFRHHFAPLIRQADDLGMKYTSVESSMFVAEAMMQIHDLAHASQELVHALTLSEKLGMQPLSARAHYLLATIDMDSGKGSDAPSHFREVLRLLDVMKKDPGGEKLLQRADFKALYEGSTKGLQGIRN